MPQNDLASRWRAMPERQVILKGTAPPADSFAQSSALIAYRLILKHLILSLSAESAAVIGDSDHEDPRISGKRIV